jgi:dihydrofolate reductase
VRKIVAGLFVSVDGVVEAAETWTGEITGLKQQPGKNINISGSATLVAWLLRQGLLDALDLLVFPVVVGHGKRLFDSDATQTGLKLADSQTYPTGVVRLAYHPASIQGAVAAMAATEPARM